MAYTSNILDPIHAELPGSLWDKPESTNPKLKSQHKKWITSNVKHILEKAGYTHMDEWLSLVLTGSLTTYQYSDDSDVDISLFVDAEVFPEWSRAEMIGIMVDQMDGIILPGTGYPMQCFVVPSDITREDLYKPGLRSGYDIETDKWIEPPDPTRTHDVEKEMNASYVFALESADKMERLLRYEPDTAIQYWHQIHKRRRREHKAGKGDFSQANIVYKFLSQRKLFPIISEISGEYIAHTAGRIIDFSEGRFEPYEEWEPGDYGKGLFIPKQDKLMLWKVEKAYDPDDSNYHHHEMMRVLGLGRNDAVPLIAIYPDGSFDIYPDGKFDEEIKALDSRLSPRAKSGWTFGNVVELQATAGKIVEFPEGYESYEEWEPGDLGKGIFIPRQDRLVLWKVEEVYDPTDESYYHHYEMAHVLGLHIHDVVLLTAIYRDGTFDCPEKSRREEILDLDSRLLPEAKSGWTFGSVEKALLKPEKDWTFSKTAGLTRNQELKELAELEAKHGPDKSRLHHQFDDGWAIVAPKSQKDIKRTGTMLRNCWQKGFTGMGGTPYVLKDPDGIHRAAWGIISAHVSNPGYSTHPDIVHHPTFASGPHRPLGRNNHPPTQEHWDHIHEWIAAQPVPPKQWQKVGEPRPEDYGRNQYELQDVRPQERETIKQTSTVKQGADINHQQVLDANRGQNLQGLPGSVNVPNLGPLQFHSNDHVQKMAQDYNRQHGIQSEHPTDYLKVNPQHGAKIAQAYEQMEHKPHDPQVKASYDALASETKAQYDHAVKNGYQFEFYPDHDPYPNSPREAVLDLHHNKHMYVYPTESGYGSGEEEYPDHPMLADSGVEWNGRKVTTNDLFRGIHDVYGHAKEGVGFRPDGEDNAYRQHAAMFTPLARKAMAAETRGQNSWVNYGEHGEHNQTAKQEDTIFAPQKAGVLPDWTEDPHLHRTAKTAAMDVQQSKARPEQFRNLGLGDRIPILFRPAGKRFYDMAGGEDLIGEDQIHIGVFGQTHQELEHELGEFDLRGIGSYRGEINENEFRWFGRDDRPPRGHEEAFATLKQYFPDLTYRQSNEWRFSSWNPHQSKKQVAKFAYDPIENHLVLGHMAAEEGEVESHYDLANKANISLQNGPLFGQISQNGYIETFVRLKGYKQGPMNQYEADFRLKKALEYVAPGAKSTGIEGPINPKWQQEFTEPRITNLGNSALKFDGSALPGSNEETEWSFS